MVAITSEELLKEQLEAAASGTSAAKEAKPVLPAFGAGRLYSAELQKLVRAVSRDINTMLVPLIRELEPRYVTDSAVNDAWPEDIASMFAALSAKWSSPQFIKAANDTAKVYVDRLNQNNSRKFQRQMRSVGLNVFGDSPEVENILSAAVADNTRLIKSIPDQYLTNVESIVYSNMRAGLRPSAITKQLSDQFGVTQNRAKLIARDQTSKANGELSKQRQEDAGFEFFKWETAKDVRVRDPHAKLAKQDIGFGPGVYRWDKPPKNEKGETIIPGQEIQCRCVPIPQTPRNVAEAKKKS
jgi:SPP1 gp7 family putative phage head morphogenesis protein